MRSCYPVAARGRSGVFLTATGFLHGAAATVSKLAVFAGSYCGCFLGRFFGFGSGSGSSTGPRMIGAGESSFRIEPGNGGEINSGAPGPGGNGSSVVSQGNCPPFCAINSLIRSSINWLR